MVSLIVLLFSTKCFLFVYIYIDLLKLQAYKLFENSDADLPWLLFLKKPTCMPEKLLGKKNEIRKLKRINKVYFRYVFV